jgi:hypothetical protein
MQLNDFLKERVMIRVRASKVIPYTVTVPKLVILASNSTLRLLVEQPIVRKNGYEVNNDFVRGAFK